jgi:hypothetical protein
MRRRPSADPPYSPGNLMPEDAALRRSRRWFDLNDPVKYAAWRRSRHNLLHDHHSLDTFEARHIESSRMPSMALLAMAPSAPLQS